MCACKQQRFVCNPNLASSKPEIITVVPQKNHTDTLQTEALAVVAVESTNAITTEKKTDKKKDKVFPRILKKLLTSITQPQDSTIKDPGLKKAQKALELEEKWLKAFAIFIGLGIIVALMLLGVFELAALLSETILIALAVLAYLGFAVTYYGIIIVFIMHIGVYRHYPKEKERHLFYVLGFVLLPYLLAILFVLLFF